MNRIDRFFKRWEKMFPDFTYTDSSRFNALPTEIQTAILQLKIGNISAEAFYKIVDASSLTRDAVYEAAVFYAGSSGKANLDEGGTVPCPKCKRCLVHYTDEDSFSCDICGGSIT
jgi:hypothetical protein